MLLRYYSQGDEVSLTGETTIKHGGLFHYAKLLEGHLKGDTIVISDDDKKRQDHNNHLAHIHINNIRSTY